MSFKSSSTIRKNSNPIY